MPCSVSTSLTRLTGANLGSRLLARSDRPAPPVPLPGQNALAEPDRLVEITRRLLTAGVLRDEE